MALLPLALLVLAAEDVRTLVAEGRAPQSLGETRAFAAARDDALRKIVSVACASLAQSDPSMKDCAIVDDPSLSELDGLIANPEDVEKTTTKTHAVLKVRADVAMQSLARHEREVQRLLQSVSGKKLGMGVIEQHTTEDGEEAPDSTAILATKTAELFRTRNGLKPFSIAVVDGEKPAEVVEVGKQDEVDLALVGLVKTKDLSEGPSDYVTDSGGSRYRARWRVERSGRVMLFDVATREQLSTVELPYAVFFDTNKRGSGAETRRSLLEQDGVAVFNAMRADLITRLRQRELVGKQIELVLSGVNDDAPVATLVADLKKLPRVRDAEAGLVRDGVVKVKVHTATSAKDFAGTIRKKLKGKVSITAVNGISLTGTLSKSL